MLIDPPNLRYLLLAVSTLLLLPLAMLAQFTGIALSPESTAETANDCISDTHDDPTFVGPENKDFDGSFGELDRGFGTYLAPRSGPVLRRSGGYLNLRASEVGDIAAMHQERSAAFLINPQSFLLALVSPDKFSNEWDRTHNLFHGYRFGWQLGTGFSF